MQKEQQELANLIKGKKVAFIGAGVSHKTLIKEFVELGAHVTLCDQKKSVEDFGDYAATIKELGIDLSLGENYLDGFNRFTCNLFVGSTAKIINPPPPAPETLPVMAPA